MTDDPNSVCDTCTITLTVQHDRNGKTLVCAVHAAGCPLASPTFDVARANQ